MKRTELKRKAPIKRTRLKAKPRKPKAGNDPAYLASVRALPCCSCEHPAPSHAHHEILNGRGKAQKAPDSRTMPLCLRCHDNFHRLLECFGGWSKAKRREWQAVMIARTQAMVFDREWQALQDR